MDLLRRADLALNARTMPLTRVLHWIFGCSALTAGTRIGVAGTTTMAIIRLSARSPDAGLWLLLIPLTHTALQRLGTLARRAHRANMHPGPQLGRMFILAVQPIQFLMMAIDRTPAKLALGLSYLTLLIGMHIVTHDQDGGGKHVLTRAKDKLGNLGLDSIAAPQSA